jgi:hypothetical protein
MHWMTNNRSNTWHDQNSLGIDSTDRITLQMMEEELEISRETVHRILVEDLESQKTKDLH